MKRKLKQTVMVKYSTNINKTNKHISPQLTEHKNKGDNNIWRWKSRTWLGTDTKM